MELTIFKAMLAFTLIKLLTPVCMKISLVDKPDERKHHESAVPLIGGLVIYLTLLIFGMLFFGSSTGLLAYYFAAGMLNLVGVLDDRFNLSVRLRVLATLIATGIMVFFAGTVFTNLGNMFGFGYVVIPLWLAVLSLKKTEPNHRYSPVKTLVPCTAY